MKIVSWYILCNLIFKKILIVLLFINFQVDGQLSNREFVAVMKNRLLRGLEKPKDTGFVKFIESVGKCAKESTPIILDLWTN